MIDALKIAAYVECDSTAISECLQRIEGVLREMDIALSATGAIPDRNFPISDDAVGYSELLKELFVSLREQVSIIGEDACISATGVPDRALLLFWSFS